MSFWRFRNGWEFLALMVPLLADSTHYFFHNPLQDFYLNMFRNPTHIVAGLCFLVAVYFGFIINLFLIEKLEPLIPLSVVTLNYNETTRTGGRRTYTHNTTWPRIIFDYPSVMFGITFFVGIIEYIRFAEKDQLVSDNVAFYLLLILVAMVIFHIIALAVSFSEKPKIPPTSPRHLAWLIPIYLLNELALVFSTALWIYLFGSDKVDPNRTGKLFECIAIFPVYFFLFSAPRFTLLCRQFTWPNLISAIILVSWIVWQSLDYVAL